jgi:hypothetical protein
MYVTALVLLLLLLGFFKKNYAPTSSAYIFPTESFVCRHARRADFCDQAKFAQSDIRAGPAQSMLVFLPAGTECDQAIVAAAADSGGFVVANDMDITLAVATLTDLPMSVCCIRLIAGIRGPCRMLRSGPGINHEAAFKEAEEKAALTLARVSVERDDLKKHLQELNLQQQPQVFVHFFLPFCQPLVTTRTPLQLKTQKRTLPICPHTPRHCLTRFVVVKEVGVTEFCAKKK